jgi:hypothetical protein
LSINAKIERRAEVIIFHDGGSMNERVKRRAEQEVVYEQIHGFKTAEELRELLHYLALKAGILEF